MTSGMQVMVGYSYNCNPAMGDMQLRERSCDSRFPGGESLLGKRGWSFYFASHLYRSIKKSKVKVNSIASLFQHQIIES